MRFITRIKSSDYRLYPPDIAGTGSSSYRNLQPEAGATYTARYYKPVNTLVNTQVGIAGASAPAYTPSGALENMRVTVESVKSGLASWQILEHTFMSQPPAFIYLDEITPLPRSVLSIKKLISTATLSIRVRRSNDNVEQDIGFTGNALNTAALSTFVGANTAYLVTAYDQTGNLQHAVQATASKQPRIVNAGTYDGKLVFDGIDDALTITVLQNTGTSCAVYSKLKQSIGGAAKVIFESSSNTNLNDGALVFYSDASNYGTAMNDGPSGSTVKINRFSFDLSVMKQASILFDRTLTGTDEIKSWVAGVALTPTAELTFEQTGNFASFDSHIGARAGTSLYADMELETFVFYNTDTSAVRSSIEALI